MNIFGLMKKKWSRIEEKAGKKESQVRARS